VTSKAALSDLSTGKTKRDHTTSKLKSPLNVSGRKEAHEGLGRRVNWDSYEIETSLPPR